MSGKDKDTFIVSLLSRTDLPRELHTPRLHLRRWRPSDLAPFATLNAHPRVMEYYPKPLTPDESDALTSRIQAHFEQFGFGLWAVEIPNVAPFAGFVGLAVPSFEAHFTPCVEIGWRLAVDYWGNGYATEAARTALAFAFETLELGDVVSFTTTRNRRSRRVMERIGMSCDPADDFDYPTIGHPLRRHVLYRITRQDGVNGN